VCLSYLHPQPQVYARYICRRLRRRAPHLKLVVCCWNLAPSTGQTEDVRRQMAADAVFVSLEGCVDQVAAWISLPASTTGTPAVAPDTEQDQLTALQDLGLTSLRERRFDDVSRSVAQSFDVPIALVSFVDDVHRPQAEGAGQNPEAQGPGRAPHEETLDAHVIAANEVLVSEDVTEDPRFADDPLVLEKGIRFYAGAPLRTSSGVVVGSLCIIDTQPREFPEENRQRLQQMADELMVRIENRATEQSAAAPVSSVEATGRT
jgi:GAF domain-containing protein